jgi:hypothetical protein
MAWEDVMDIPKDVYDQIAREIESGDSPVGIDAKKAHVIIIHKLMELERRLQRLEEKLEAQPAPREPIH